MIVSRASVGQRQVLRGEASCPHETRTTARAEYASLWPDVICAKRFAVTLRSYRACNTAAARRCRRYIPGGFRGRRTLNDGGRFGSQLGPNPFALNVYSALPDLPAAVVSMRTTCSPARAGLQ